MKRHPSVPPTGDLAAGDVVPLGVEIVVPPPPEPSRPNRLHGAGIAGMTLSAFVGILTMIALISVRWPEDTGRYVVVVLVASIVGFLVCASVAVSAAMRDTYSSTGPSDAVAREDDAERPE